MPTAKGQGLEVKQIGLLGAFDFSVVNFDIALEKKSYLFFALKLNLTLIFT
ncbi:hypothetical protein Hanom_Chr05g00467421 [Helianthus anomalus]